MGCEQVCLKWNNFSLNITKNIDDLWKDESLVDVSLISDGQCIQAHKVILSASSPLFKSLFAVNPCQHPVIILQDVRFRELVSIITFIYKGEVNIFEESLPALLQAAKTLQIRGLSDSVDRDSLNRLYALRSEESERAAKKRRTGNSNCATSEPQSPEESSSAVPEKIIPKEEPKGDGFSAEFMGAASDEEDVKTEDLVMHDRTQDMLPSELGSTDDGLESVSVSVNVSANDSGNDSGYPCPFCLRTYTNWGFRRRHIKAVHCPRDELPCKWCVDGAFAPDQWVQHALRHHRLTADQVHAHLHIYTEAKTVLQETNTHHL